MTSIAMDVAAVALDFLLNLWAILLGLIGSL